MKYLVALLFCGVVAVAATAPCRRCTPDETVFLVGLAEVEDSLFLHWLKVDVDTGAVLEAVPTKYIASAFTGVGSFLSDLEVTVGLRPANACTAGSSGFGGILASFNFSCNDTHECLVPCSVGVLAGFPEGDCQMCAATDWNALTWVPGTNNTATQLVVLHPCDCSSPSRVGRVANVPTNSSGCSANRLQVVFRPFPASPLLLNEIELATARSLGNVSLGSLNIIEALVTLPDGRFDAVAISGGMYFIVQVEIFTGQVLQSVNTGVTARAGDRVRFGLVDPTSLGLLVVRTNSTRGQLLFYDPDLLSGVTGSLIVPRFVALPLVVDCMRPTKACTC